MEGKQVGRRKGRLKGWERDEKGGPYLMIACIYTIESSVDLGLDGVESIED